MPGTGSFGRLSVNDTALLLIYMQEKFVPVIHEIERVTDNCARLVRGCRELGVPILVTEQYPRGLGRTVPQVAEALGKFRPMEKTAFSLFDDEAVSLAILDMNRPNLLVAGVEAHVCVIRTAMDARGAGYTVHWVRDAISSRTAANAETATRRAQQCGAFMASTEMVLFQMIDTAEHMKFRAISKIVK